MSVKMMLIDFDGTLLGPGQVAVSNRNMEAMQKAAEQGVLVVPSTGRVADMFPPQILTADFVRYIISSHGSRILDRQTGRVIYLDTFTPEESWRILKIIEKKGLYAEIAAEGTIYVEQELADHLMDYPIPYHHFWYMRDRRFTAVENIADYFLEHNIGIEKVNLYGMPDGVYQEIYDELAKTGLPKFIREGAHPDIEFSRYSFDKMKAINAMLSDLGIDFADVFAIGDAPADYELLKASGISVAMENAVQMDKDVAKYITASNVEDGVAIAIENYVLKSEPAQDLADINTFKKTCDKLVCIDSDGCAMDTMEIKHKECFCTAFIECFGLQGIAKYAREAWDYTNLYSKTRGFYRMKTLVMSIELLAKRREVVERGFKLPDVTPLKEWMACTPVLSDATLLEYTKDHKDEILFRTLEWSAEVNKRVKRIVHDVPPFVGVRESLAKLQGKADVVVVSATPTAALQKEWAEHDVKKYTAFICGQEYGNKKDVITAVGKQYGQGNVLMIGDAIGDWNAAEGAGAAFYPICPNREDESWKLFYNEVSDLYVGGAYDAKTQKIYTDMLDDCLADRPSWDEI